MMNNVAVKATYSKAMEDAPKHYVRNPAESPFSFAPALECARVLASLSTHFVLSVYKWTMTLN
jgi:hypothetical protein